eukprot:scaffold305168_cov15-Tisochrysis_lutea.AAC.1
MHNCPAMHPQVESPQTAIQTSPCMSAPYIATVLEVWNSLLTSAFTSPTACTYAHVALTCSHVQ